MNISLMENRLKIDTSSGGMDILKCKALTPTDLIMDTGETETTDGTHTHTHTESKQKTNPEGRRIDVGRGRQTPTKQLTPF